MSTRTRGDWILWGALGCTLVVTAHAEYTLAVATGAHWLVAGAVPGALDLYVIRALQKHRDVLPAVLVMVAANVASHLLTAGVLPVHWAVISAVGALAPLLLWRIHYLWRVQARDSGAVSAPEYTAPEGAPDSVPEWMEEEYAATLPVPEPWVAVSAPALPPLPPEYTGEYTAQVHSEPVLSADDAVHLGSAHAYLAECTEVGRTPSIRGLKEFGHVSQDRAKRLLAHLREGTS